MIVLNSKHIITIILSYLHAIILPQYYPRDFRIMKLVSLYVLHIVYYHIMTILSRYYHIIPSYIILHLVGGLEHFLFFHSVGNVIIPTDEVIFFRGVGQPPTCHYHRYHLRSIYIPFIQMTRWIFPHDIIKHIPMLHIIILHYHRL